MAATAAPAACWLPAAPVARWRWPVAAGARGSAAAGGQGRAGPSFGPGRRGGRGRSARDVLAFNPCRCPGGRPGQQLQPHEGHRGALGRHLALPQPSFRSTDPQQLTDGRPPREVTTDGRGAPAHRRRTQPRRGTGRRWTPPGLAAFDERQRARGLPAQSSAGIGRRAQTARPRRFAGQRAATTAKVDALRKAICSSPRTDPHPLTSAWGRRWCPSRRTSSAQGDRRVSLGRRSGRVAPGGPCRLVTPGCDPRVATALARPARAAATRGNGRAASPAVRVAADLQIDAVATGRDPGATGARKHDQRVGHTGQGGIGSVPWPGNVAGRSSTPAMTTVHRRHRGRLSSTSPTGDGHIGRSGPRRRCEYSWLPAAGRTGMPARAPPSAADCSAAAGGDRPSTRSPA